MIGGICGRVREGKGDMNYDDFVLLWMNNKSLEG